MIDLEKLFEKHNKEYHKFEKVEDKKSNRADICAFIILDGLVPKARDIVAAVRHDEIYFDTDISELSKVITEEEVITLIRCGIRLDVEEESLCMFV